MIIQLSTKLLPKAPKTPVNASLMRDFMELMFMMIFVTSGRKNFCKCSDVFADIFVLQAYACDGEKLVLFGGNLCATCLILLYWVLDAA